MWRTSCSLGPLLMAVCGSLLCSAPAAADPVYDDGSAESVVNDLKAQGYNVVIKLVDRLQHQVAFGLPSIEYKQPWPVGPTPGHLHHGLRRRVLPQPRLRLSGDRPGSLRAANRRSALSTNDFPDRSATCRPPIQNRDRMPSRTRSRSSRRCGLGRRRRPGHADRQAGFNIFIVKRDVTPLTRGMVMTRRLRKISYAGRSATATRTK